VGRVVVHVYAEASPGPGYAPVEPDLEDVYFCTLRGLLETAAPAPAEDAPSVAETTASLSP
jgi:hypothetical protein